jgi:hypothetical protein
MLGRFRGELRLEPTPPLFALPLDGKYRKSASVDAMSPTEIFSCGRSKRFLKLQRFSDRRLGPLCV